MLALPSISDARLTRPSSLPKPLPPKNLARSESTRLESAMPIRANLRPLYPSNWPALSRHVRFIRAAGRCQACARPHGTDLRCLPDGRWFDAQQNTWRNRRGRPAPWPDLLEATQIRTTRVSLATAHLDHDPTHNRLRNLRSLCQRCHLSHDRAHHLAQRRLTYRSRDAIGDLWLGVYADAARAA